MASIEISWGIEEPEWLGKFEGIGGNDNRCSRVETIVVNASEIEGGKLGFSGIAFVCKCILPIDESRVNIAPVNYSRFMNLTSPIFLSVYRESVYRIRPSFQNPLTRSFRFLDEMYGIKLSSEFVAGI